MYYTVRLLEQEEENDKVLLELNQKKDLLLSLCDQHQKHDRDGSSRIANLNQALMQAKQACAQLTEENEAISQKEVGLVRRVEELELENASLLKRQSSPCRDCVEREFKHQHGSTPVRNMLKPGHTAATPIKPFPEETEMDSLQIENNKLKQELQCLQTNFQIASQKSFQMKKEAKENEKALIELQSQFEQILAEKDNLKQMYEEINTAFANTTGSQLREREKGLELESEVATLRTKVDEFQQCNVELQEQVNDKLKHSMETQDIIEKLDARLKTLKEQKSELEHELSAAHEKILKLDTRLLSFQQASETQCELQQHTSAIVQSYEHKLTVLVTEKEELGTQLEKVEMTLDATRDQVNILKESRRDLQIKLAALEARNAVLVAKGRQQSVLPDEVEKLQKDLVQLSERYEEVCGQNKQHNVDQQRSKSHIEELKKTNSQLQQEVKQNWELANKLEEELKKHESSFHVAQEDLYEKQMQCTKMENMIEELQLELASVNHAKSMYEKEVDKLLKHLEALEQCNFELTTKLSDTENHTASTQYTLTEAQTKMFDMEAKLQEAESMLLEKESLVSDLRCNCGLMETENTTLLSQVTSLSEMVAARNTKIEALQATLNKYELDTQEIVQMITELEADHGQCGKVKAALQNEIDSLQQSLESALVHKKETESTILSLKLEVKQLQVYNSSLESINADLQTKIQTQIAKCEELTCDQLSAENREYDLKQKLKTKSALLKSALEEVEFTKKRTEDAQMVLRAECESFEAKCRKLHEECENLYEEKKRMEARIVVLQSELGEQKQTVSTLTSEKEALSNKLEISHSTLVATKDELLAVSSKLENVEAAQKYTEKKLSESKFEVESVRDELSAICKQYEMLRDSALSLLEPDSSSDGDGENSKIAPKRKRLKGILKTSSSVLKPMENLVD